MTVSKAKKHKGMPSDTKNYASVVKVVAVVSSDYPLNKLTRQQCEFYRELTKMINVAGSHLQNNQYQQGIDNWSLHYYKKMRRGHFSIFNIPEESLACLETHRMRVHCRMTTPKLQLLKSGARSAQVNEAGEI